MIKRKEIVRMNEIQEFEDLKKLAKPIQEWLTSHFNPMCSVVVDVDRVTIISRELSTSTNTNED